MNPCFLDHQIQEMIRENETIPENERLKDEEFNLDLEEQHRLEAMIKQEVDQVMWGCKRECVDAMMGMIPDATPLQVREDIEWEILEKYYLYDVLKKECWDSMKVNRKAIKVRWVRKNIKNKCCISQQSQNVQICTDFSWCASQAFHSELEVINYPLKERTEKEMLELQRVQIIRRIEMAVSKLVQNI